MKELFNNIISVQFGASIAIVLLLLSRSMMKKRYVAKLRYWLWLVVALRLCLPVDINIHMQRTAPVNIPVNDYYVVSHQTDSAEQPAEFELITIDQLDRLPVADTPRTENTPAVIKSVSVTDILYRLWLMVAILLIQISFISFYLARKDIMSTAVYSEEMAVYTEKLKSSMGINKKVRTAVCAYTGSPMLLGIINPVIVLPDQEYTDIQLEMIVRHELTHLKRNDILYKLLLHTVACVYWFNPLTACMARLAGKDIEISCDEDVVKTGDKQFKTDYAQIIIRVISMQNNKLILATNFSQNARTVKERFFTILNSRSLKNGHKVFVLFVTVIVFSTTAITCTLEKNDYSIINTVYYDANNYKNFFGLHGEIGDTKAVRFTVVSKESEWTYDCRKITGDIGESIKIYPRKRYLYCSNESEKILETAIDLYGTAYKNIFADFTEDIYSGNFVCEDNYLKWKKNIDDILITVNLYKKDNRIFIDKINISNEKYINNNII